MFFRNLKILLKFIFGESMYRAITKWIDYIIYAKRRYKYSSKSDARALAFNWKSTNFNRIATLNLIACASKSQSYLEIGCSSNATFDSIPILDKIGVDPFYGGNRRMTSDAFFENNAKRFDLIFIDGDHDYRQARRDLTNSLRVINEGGFIVLHDMLPRNWIESHVPIVTPGAWTGDVWKLAFELIHIEGIDFRIIKIDQGVGVIKIKGSRISLGLDSFVSKSDFSYYYDNLQQLPMLDWHDAFAWLSDLRA